MSLLPGQEITSVSEVLKILNEYPLIGNLFDMVDKLWVVYHIGNVRIYVAPKQYYFLFLEIN